MYAETGAAMRTHLAALLEQHRIQYRLSAEAPGSRRTHGAVILQYRQNVLVWCGQALQVAMPRAFTNLPPRSSNPFKPTGRSSPATELARAVALARDTATATIASAELLTTPSTNPVTEQWRHIARAAALAEHDTDPDGQLTTQQAHALVGDVAAIAQALVVLDERYKHTPGWEQLAERTRLGWTALAAALDVSLGQVDYSVDDLGWRPMTRPIRTEIAKPGILGVLQAEHDLSARLRSFPHLINLRVVVDSQRLLSHHLIPFAARAQPGLVKGWETRTTTYTRLQHELRDLAGLLGAGELAAADAATAVARMKKINPDTTVEPRVLGGFQVLFDRIDHRIADIIEEGLQRKAYAQRVTLPRLDAGTGRITQPVRERFRPITRAHDLSVVHTVRQRLRPATTERPSSPGASRAELHAALVHRAPSRREPGPGVSL
jgi:hypothetical protein